MAIVYQNFELKQNQGLQLTGYEWNVPEPKSVVCLIHGIGEHAGRYDRIGTMFADHGIALLGMDLRGHGLSPGKRGHTAPRTSILSDADRLLECAMEKYPDSPIFLYGHSMGGNIVLDYRKRGRLRTIPAAYIVTSPWITLVRKIPGYLYYFTKFMAKVKPDFLMSSKINPEILGNLEVISKQENMHLIHGNISVKTAMEGFEIGEALMNGTLKDSDSDSSKPLLLMHGSADRICSPEGSRAIAGLEKGACQYIEWEGLYHEIHNGNSEKDGTEVINTMIRWIEEAV